MKKIVIFYVFLLILFSAFGQQPGSGVKRSYPVIINPSETEKSKTSPAKPVTKSNTKVQPSNKKTSVKQANEVIVKPAQSTKPIKSEPDINTTTTPQYESNNYITPIVTVPPKKEDRMDTLIRMGGKKVGLTVMMVNANTVNVVYKDGRSDELRRKDIEKIIFKSGKVEVFNKPVFEMVSTTSWEAVYVTENPADVEGFYNIGKVKGVAATNSPNFKAAKASAIIRMQKKAAKMGGLFVLITKQEARGGYGESPNYDMEGLVYAVDPPVIPVKPDKKKK